MIMFFFSGHINSMNVLSKSPDDDIFKSSLFLNTNEFLMNIPEPPWEVLEQSKTNG